MAWCRQKTVISGGEAAWTREEEHRQGTEVPGCAAGQVVASHRAQAQARLYSCQCSEIRFLTNNVTIPQTNSTEVI